MRSIGVLFVISLIVCGCASNPTVPSIDDGSSQNLSVAGMTSQDGNHRLWGEWEIHIDATHTHAEAIPIRSGRFHLNTIKFLEDYCKDCLHINSIHKNPDDTVNLSVTIHHPFNGFPQYTGFDVKGIIMFEGSHEFIHPWGKTYLPLYPQNFHVSWRLLGDPELLNAEGYSFRWSPWYESGSDMPIFNYWEGRYSKGTPTANINGYLNFYTDEERHMFRDDGSVTRVYHLWLPPGEPVVAGYAVEACWEPPTTTPVTDPASDFPITANQPEAYHFHCVLNDGEPMTQDDPCCNVPVRLEEQRAEMNFWYLVPETFPDSFWVSAWCPEIAYYHGVTVDCDAPPDWRCLGTIYPFYKEEDDTYQFIAFEWHVWQNDPDEPLPYVAVDLFEIVVDYH